MKRARLGLRFALALLATTTVFVGCRPSGANSEGLLNVVCTSAMIADAARIIGGSQAQVTGLMGPGVDPHLYIASREDQRRLSRAELVLYHGLHLEGKMVKFLEGLREKRQNDSVIVAVAEVISKDKLIRNEAFGDYPDPHVWFDLNLWRPVVAEITRAFCKRDPEHTEEYRSRGAAYSVELAKLHENVLERVAKVPRERRKIVTSHDAYNYLARAYGFEVYGLQGISTVTPAGLKDIQKAVEYVQTHKVPVIFAETSVPHASVEEVARHAGCKVSEKELFSDALGDPQTPEGSFLGMFRYNIDTLIEGLNGDVKSP